MTWSTDRYYNPFDISEFIQSKANKTHARKEPRSDKSSVTNKLGTDTFILPARYSVFVNYVSK